MARIMLFTFTMRTLIINEHGGRVVTNFKSVKILFAVLVTSSLLSIGSMARGSEKNETPEKLTYKFRVLKDKISALSVRNGEEVEQTKETSDMKNSAVKPDMTSETVIIRTVDGVTVIGNDPAKTAMSGMMMKNDDGRPRVWVEDRVRFEENSSKTNGGNFNRSSIINRMRLNLKMNLGRKVTANFSGDRNNNFGDNTQNRSEEPVTHGNVVVDMDK